MPHLLILLAALIAPVTTLAAQPVFDPISMEAEPHAEFPPALEELAFDSQGQRLAGLIYLANGPGPHPTVVLLHGFPGNEKNLDIAQAVRRDGFNVMFFHYRGAWGSEGEYSLTSVDDDALAALNFLRQPENAARYRVDTGKLTLLGHSLGGYVSLAAGSQDEKLVCVGAMSPANLAAMAAGIKAEDPAMLAFLTYADGLFMLRGMSGARMLEQLQSVPVAEINSALFGPGLRGKSVFMVVGDQDRVTSVEQMFNPVAQAYFEDGKIRLQRHVIPGDHSFSWSRLHLTRLLLNWLEKDCR